MTPLTLPSGVDAVWPVEDASLLAHRAVLEPIVSLSPYLANLVALHPEQTLRCLDGDPQDVIDNAIPSEEPSVAKALRIAKQRIALSCALADLTGLWDTMTVTRHLAEFADRALELALAEAVRSVAARGKLDWEKTAPPTGIGIVAMGKHGAYELNYSSDIDVIVLFDPDDPIFPDRSDALDAAVRVTREVVRLMQDRTADGYVFRTDLRLRPDPGSMPLAISLQMAEIYYETRGQNWERAAWIKARHAAGDPGVTDAVFARLRPFIWRRYLDFAAIADIHSIKRQIQAHRDILDLAVPGHNLKLGRGGIREIEFFVQTQQLIAGGRDERLRGRGTLAMLEALADGGWIEKPTAEELTESYLFLRDIEHRLQMIDDRQIHSLPDAPEAMANVAALSGYADVAEFEDDVRRHLIRTEAHYAALFADEPDLGFDEGNLSFTGDDPDPDTVRTLETLGFQRPADMIAVVKGWHFGRAPAMRSASSRERLTSLVPQLLQTFAGRADPDAALLSFDAFLSGLPAGVQLFALLDANESLTGLLLDILSDAPRMAALVQRRPHVLDAVVEPRFFSELPDRQQLEVFLKGSLDQALDYEGMLDRARTFAAEQRFLVSIRLMGRTIGVERAGRAYSLLADVVLNEMLTRVHEAFAERHGQVPDGRMAIVAMGRLGSSELTAASDLDLIFITDRPDPNIMSDGPKPLSAAQYDMRLVQQLIAAMNARTAEGRLYELDFRLRPSGNSGPLATTLSGFATHQRDRAKTWEHLALTRARVIAGDPSLRDEIEAVVAEVVDRPRDQASVAADVREMRALMDDERPPKGSLDVKLAPGGLVDLEFIAQFALLTRMVEPKVRHEGIPAVLAQLDEPGLVEGYELASSILQLTRLGLADEHDAYTPGLLRRILDIVGEPDEARLRARLAESQAVARKAFERIVS